MINNLIALITCHMFGDYVFQNDFIAKFKATNNFILFVHCWLWSTTISFGLYRIDKFEMWKFIFLLVGHFAIDYLKSRKVDKTNALTNDLYVDQIGHLVQLLIVIA